MKTYRVTKKIITIIGDGIIGLSCAVKLAEAGAMLSLLETTSLKIN